MAKELGIPEDEKSLVSAAGLLHDIGHTPFSHVLESTLKEKLGINHMELTKEIITGKFNMAPMEEIDNGSAEEWGRIPEVLEQYGLDPEKVAELVTGSVDTPPSIENFDVHKGQAFFNEKKYLYQIVHGVIDADQIDYLLRDAYYTGVAHGAIDVERLLQTLSIFNNDLVVDKKGVSAVEGMLVARSLMYTSVYFHKTSRIAQLMLGRAVERTDDNDIPELHKMADPELMTWLTALKGYPGDMALRLRYRRLFKATYLKRLEELDEDQRAALQNLADPKSRREKEDLICSKAGIPEGYVLVDTPVPELLFSEPRISKTEIKVRDKDRIKHLSKYSTLAKPLQSRNVTTWVVAVSTPSEYTEKVDRVVEKVLYG